MAIRPQSYLISALQCLALLGLPFLSFSAMPLGNERLFGGAEITTLNGEDDKKPILPAGISPCGGSLNIFPPPSLSDGPR